MQNQKTFKVVLYRRLSKQKASGNQYGFDSQEVDLQNWLTQNPNAEVVGEYGEFYSGRGHYSKRKEFNKALAKCKELDAYLVINKPDRLARDVESGAHILNNYKVVFTNYPDADTLTKHILLTVAQAESDNTSARVTASLKVAKSKGVKLGAASDAYQQKLAQGKINHVSKRTSSEASDYWQQHRPQIEHIINMMKASKTKLTFANICSNLNKMNITSREGKPLNPSQTQRILDKLNISRV